MADFYSQQVSTTSVTSTDKSAIYYDVSPHIVFFVRFLNVGVLILIIIGMVLSIVQASEDTAYYLLTANLGISSVIGIVVNWWYRGGDLAVDKYWFIIVVALVLSFQSIMTDIFVFHDKPPVEAITTTLAPGNSTTPITMVTIRNNTNKTILNNLMTTPTVVYYLH